MRQLRFVGVDADGAVVECELTDSGEKVALPLDDALRRAVDGAPGGAEEAGGPARDALSTAPAARPGSSTVSRPAPAAGPGSGSAGMRPKEIQDRIRHGASPEAVAAEAGVPLSRIEGFAYPVMLERYTAGERARRAHPVLPDGPALDTLEQRVAEAVEPRGVDPEVVRWDAWRERKTENWIVRTSWPMGLSDDVHATWRWVPDSHGGAAHPLDTGAEDVLDPAGAELRAVRSLPEPEPEPAPVVTTLTRVRSEESAPEGFPGSTDRGHADRGAADPGVAGRGAPPVHSVPAPAAPAARLPEPPGQVRVSPVPPGEQEAGRHAGPPPAATGEPTPAPFMVAEPRRRRAPEPDRGPEPHHGPGAGGDARTAAEGHTDTDTHTDPDTGEDFLQHPPDRPEKKSSRRHPTMPSWEDVLLGVRSKDD